VRRLIAILSTFHGSRNQRETIRIHRIVGFPVNVTLVAWDLMDILVKSRGLKCAVVLGLVLELQCPNLPLYLPRTISQYDRTGQHPHGLWRCYLRRQDRRGEWNTSISDRSMGLFYLWSLRRDRGSCLPGSQAIHPPNCDLNKWPLWPTTQWRDYNNNNANFISPMLIPRFHFYTANVSKQEPPILNPSPYALQ